MTRTRLALAVTALVGVALVLSLAAAEAALRFIIPAPKVYRLLLPGTRIIEPDARYVHGISGPARYIVNQHGIRGREFGPDSAEYRVLLVGSSTTENAMLDEEENWGVILERELGRTRDGRKVWVGNVGRSGHTSRDHAVAIKYLLPQYPRIDLILTLTGGNDLTAALRQGSQYRSPAPLSDPKTEALQVRNAFALSPGGFRELIATEFDVQSAPWYRNTRLFQMAKRARTGMYARQVVRGIGGATLAQWRLNRQSASKIVTEPPALERPLADFRSNLEAVLAEARARNVEIILLTQPVLWRNNMPPAEEKLLWLGGTGGFMNEPGHEYYAVPVLAQAQARYNAELMSVCRERGRPCLDLASVIPSDTVMFYDDVHFTEAGAAAVGRAIATHLRAIKPALFETPRPTAKR